MVVLGTLGKSSTGPASFSYLPDHQYPLMADTGANDANKWIYARNSEPSTHDRGTVEGKEVKALPAPSTEEPAAEMTTLEKFSGVVDGGLRNFFERVTGHIADRPGACIISCLVLTAALASGFSMFEQENESSRLWTPQGTRALKDRDWIETTFGAGERGEIFYFAPSADDGSNMITTGRLLQVLKLWDKVQTITATRESVTYSFGGSGNTTGLCLRDGQDCRTARSPLMAWNYSAAALNADPNPLATLNAFEAVFPVGGPGLSHYLGSVRRGATGLIEHVGALKLAAELENNVVETGKGRKDLNAQEWELQVGSEVQGDELGEGVVVQVYLRGYTTEESSKGLKADVMVLPMGYLLCTIYVAFVFWNKRSRKSHILVGMMGVLSVGFSTLSAYGLAFMCGVKYNPVVSVLVLVLLGIGVDDSFVIFDAWLGAEFTETGEKETNVRRRLIRAMREAGPSITTTSVTDIVAFAAGTATGLPALQGFCIFAVFGIFFDFLYQCTFVVAVLYLDGCREEDGCPCCATGPTADCCCCCAAPDETMCCCCTTADPPAKDRRYLQEFMGTKLPAAMLTPAGSAFVVVVACALFAVGVVGFVNLEMNFNFEWFVPADSPLQDTFALRDKHFQTSTSLPLWFYTEAAPYHTRSVQLKLLALEKDISAQERVISASVDSWLDAFIISLGLPAGATADELTFYADLWAFLDSPQGERWNSSVQWAPDRSSIVATRVSSTLQGWATETGSKSVATMEAMRSLIDNPNTGYSSAPLYVRAYNPGMVGWEGLAVIQWETLRNVIVAAACVFVVSLVLLANVAASLGILVIILLIDVDLLGFTHWAGYEYNSVSCINIVLAIGLSVDYTAHIIRAFLGRSGSRFDRTAFALRDIGSAVLNGGISTFLAVLPLVTAKSYVFSVFFAMFTFIVVFGLFHGVLLSPVFLRWAGPAPYPDALPIPADAATAPPAVPGDAGDHEMNQVKAASP